jgi:hypothetical protein
VLDEADFEIVTVGTIGNGADVRLTGQVGVILDATDFIFA